MMRNLLTSLALLGFSAAPFAADAVAQTEKQATNWHAIIMFCIFVALTMGLRLVFESALDGVKTILSDFLMRSFPEPAKAAVVACVKAGLRYDLRVRQNMSAFTMLTLLRSIPWIKDASGKPPVLFGEVFIAID